MTFEIAVSVASLVSLGLSIFATVKVIKIQSSLKITDARRTKVSDQTIIGSGNRQAGGDVNA
jgi:hypothetical protein